MFEILGKLGVGGMADVFLANVELDGRVQAVALKRIRASMSDAPEVWAQFHREAEICKLLRHEAIVQLKAFGNDAEGPYLALEYVQGATAAELVKASARRGDVFPLKHALVICRDAAAGVAHAHGLVHASGRGVVHRDISPDNVLVGYDGRAKVTDFGIARLEGHTRFTATGEVRGKMGYLAPELVEGGEPSHASDVFALAATVFRVFSGVPAFRGNNEGEVFRSLMFAATPKLAAVRPDVPAAVAEWVYRAFAKGPGPRPSASELVEAIPEPAADDRKALGAWLAEVHPPRVFARAAVSDEKPPSAVTSSRPDPALAATLTDVEAATGPKTVSPKTPAPLGPRRTGPWLPGAFVVVLVGAAAAWLWPRERAPVPEPVMTVTPRSPVEPPREPEPAAQAPSEEPEEEAAAEEPQPAPGKPRKARKGWLDVRVTPFADVFVDGKLVGSTPLKPLELAPGMHNVILVNSELNVRKTLNVKIEAGKKARIAENLR